ncbi:hypothetical protein, partial [Thiolapillus sp.]|uniref:hypothetical protein n=1 Tax=Thiolapillus sp. TaxID=2017437 RepID=UPI003AF9E692
LESDRLPDWLQRMKYNSEYQYILMLLESVKPRVYGWTLLRVQANVVAQSIQFPTLWYCGQLLRGDVSENPHV